MKNHFAIVLFIVQSLFLRFFLFQPVIFLLQGRKGFIADIMLDLACIVEGVLFGNAHGFQNVGKDLMPWGRGQKVGPIDRGVRRSIYVFA